MLSRMAVMEGSRPYSLAICVGRRAGAALVPLREVLKKGWGKNWGPRARGYLVGHPDAGGLRDPFPRVDAGVQPDGRPI